MAASGRVPEDVLALMGQTITLTVETPATQTMYGKRIIGAGSGSTRDIKCAIQPAMSASRSHEATDVTYTYDIYCNDADITESDVIHLPNGDTPAIVGIESYRDEVGIMYQVVHC